MIDVLRHAITEPRDFAYWLRGRFVCRVLRRHHPTCDGDARDPHDSHNPRNWPERNDA